MRFPGLILCVPVLLAVTSVLAQENGEDASERLKRDPNSVDAINAYMKAKLNEIQQLSRQDPDAALERAEEMATVLENIKSDKPEARDALQQAVRYVDFVKEQVALMKTSLDELVEKLNENPTDVKILSSYVSKVMQSAAEMINTDLEAADKMLQQAKAQLDTVREKSQDNEQVVAAVDRAVQSMSSMEKFIQDQIKRQERLTELVGKEAAPLQADAWINGEPVTDEDVEGKVVLLDFWAVWCGPCIRTFPHLREWHEQYKDQGLVMIGVTSYTNTFRWDDEQNQIVQTEDEVSPAAEQAMLAEFAKKHEMPHVIAVQKDETLSEYYAVQSIPQVVLIDRQGKVRMVKVGASDETTQEIGAMLEQLMEQE